MLLLAVALAVAVGMSLVPGGVARAAPSSTDLTRQIKQESHRFESVVEQYDKVNDEKKQTSKKIDALDRRTRVLAGTVRTLRGQVSRMAATAYKSGGSLSGWNALLGGSGTDVMNGIATLDRMSNRQSEKVRQLVDAKKQLTDQRRKLSALYTKLAGQSRDLKHSKSVILGKIDKLKKLRKQAYGREQEAATASNTGTSNTGTSNTGTSNTGGQSPPNVSGRAGTVVSFAYAQLGKPYVWAAAGPDSYDCSGLTLAAWARVGVTLPHNAAQQYNQIAHLDRSAIAPGDLVFYENLGHVAIYVGGGKVIHAPTFGEVVKVSSIDMMPVYGIGRP